jgi:hypothetical protein
MIFHREGTTNNINIGSIIAAVGVGTAVYSAYRLIRNKNILHGSNGKCEKEDIKITKSANDVLVNKIGATESDLEDARMSNKTAYDVAVENGFSKEQFNMFVNQDRTRNIDELALNRKITSEVAEQVKEKIIDHTNNWDGMLC